VLETRQLLALTVLNANDSGTGSLRQAILDANSQATSQATIVFTLPAGPQTINLLSPLPPSSHAILAQLDATQNVIVVSPATGAQDNLPALTETGGGTLTFDGTNNPTGNIQVDSGSLQLNAGDPPAAAPQPLGPVQGVDGDPLAELWPYGGVVANGNAFARGPVLFTTQAGTVLAFAGYQSSSQDNTGSNDMFVRRSNDNGKTFGAASIISPPQLPGDAALLASWGGTSWIVGSPNLVQRQDGTIYMFYEQMRNGGQQAVAQRQYVYRYMTSKDDGQTWSQPVDITAATAFGGNQNVATITAVTDPTPGVVRLTLAFKTKLGSLPDTRSMLTITGLVNDPMGLNGQTFWISNVVSNGTGSTAVVELAGTPAWRDGTTVGAASIVTPQSDWLGTVGGGEPLLRSGRIVGCARRCALGRLAPGGDDGTLGDRRFGDDALSAARASSRSLLDRLSSHEFRAAARAVACSSALWIGGRVLHYDRRRGRNCGAQPRRGLGAADRKTCPGLGQRIDRRDFQLRLGRRLAHAARPRVDVSTCL
jgi:autotransporter-associated beta strand protein